MSKPREFYLRYRMGELYCDDFEALNDGPTGFHVIEKSAVDELADALESIEKCSHDQDDEHRMRHIAKQALKNYRGDREN